MGNDSDGQRAVGAAADEASEAVIRAAQRVRLCVDLGGTHVRAAAVASDGQILSHARRSTPTGSAEAVGEAIRLTVAAARAACPPAATNAIRGPLVLAAPGPFDAARGRILDTPNLPHLRGYPLADAVAAALGLGAGGVVLANDALMAALGEALRGAGRGLDPVLFLTISTGIGGGLVIGGRAYGGAAGQAAELGHLIVDGRAGAPRCGAGHAGCLEAHASGTAIAAAAAHAGIRGPSARRRRPPTSCARREAATTRPGACSTRPRAGSGWASPAP
ncbi:MAG: ROK family protein [Anaerolineae bacterium]